MGRMAASAPPPPQLSPIKGQGVCARRLRRAPPPPKWGTAGEGGDPSVAAGPAGGRRCWRCTLAFAAFAAALLSASPARAQQTLEDVLKGFEATPAPAPPAPAPAPEAEPPAAKPKPILPRWLRLGGALGQEITLAVAHDAPPPGETDHRGLAGLRSRLDLEADVDLAAGWRGRLTGHAFWDWAYLARGRGEYTDAVLDAYESEAEIDEAYVQGRLSPALDLRLGRQIVVWGKSDTIRITDVLNPLDNRRPGRTDIAELRLPVTMTKLDWYPRPWNLSLILVHERRFDKTPAFGSDFLAAPAPLPDRDRPDAGFGLAPEAGAALNGTFRGWDLSFYAATVYDETPHVVATADGPRRRNARITLLGAAADAVAGSWLVKGEAALRDGLRFSAAPGERFTRLDVLAGVEYSGLADTRISLEAANRHLFDFDGSLRAPPDDARRNAVQTALRVRRTFAHETVELQLLAVTFGLRGEDGAFQRLQLRWDVTDALVLTVGAINYVSGDKREFRGAGDNDRIFADLTWHF